MIDLCTFITLTFAGKPVLCEVKYRRKPYGKTISVFGSLQHLPEKSAKIVTKHLYLSFPCGTMTWSQVSSAVVALTPSLSPSVESLGFLQVFFASITCQEQRYTLLRGKCSSFSFVFALCQTAEYLLIAGRSEAELYYLSMI